MSTKTRNKMLIMIFYFSSLIIFELIIGIVGFDRNAVEDIFELFAPFAEAGVYHFIFGLLLSIFISFNKKVDKSYKYIIYLFPLLTFYLTLPMIIPTCIIARLLHILF